jgi:hypothetical protein
MKFIGWVMSAGLVATATGALAQPLTPNEIGLPTYSTVSDVGGPYAAMPPEPQERRYGPERYAPPLLPRSEIYAVLRENGYSPLGVPQQRGAFYTIAVVNLDGDDGRLVIDGRNGRLVRFIPGWRIGHWADDEMVGYGPQAMLPRIPEMRRAPRPPASIPRVASRTPAVPLPTPAPTAVGGPKPESKPLAAQPAPARQSAAVAGRPDTPAAAPVAAAPAPATEAKPVTPLPSQAMPPVQGLE